MARILIVDDSKLMRKILCQALEHAGHVVVEAQDGDFAILLYAKNRPDIIIIDMMMPGMDGLELLKKLKTLDSEVRALVVTADTRKKTSVSTREAGACGLISKPYTESQILAAVDQALQETASCH